LVEAAQWALHVPQHGTIHPDYMASIRRYIDDRIPPGDFLTAVICDAT
jgi:hypothetical protein